jgi:hypothetical protein
MYPVRPRWVDYAKSKSTGQQFNRTTILEDGAGQGAGRIGEMAFGRWLMDHGHSFSYEADTSFAYDFMVAGLRVDVKTKACTSPPKAHYTAHVTQSQQGHDCDVYFFLRASQEAVWLCGWMLKQEFWGSPAGIDVQPGEMVDGLVQKTAARRIQIQDLSQCDSFLRFIHYPD